MLIVDASRQRRDHARAQDGGEQNQRCNKRWRTKSRLHEGRDDDVHREDSDEREHVHHQAHGERWDLQRTQVDERLSQLALAHDEHHQNSSAHHDRGYGEDNVSAEDGRDAIEDADERDGDQGNGRCIKLRMREVCDIAQDDRARQEAQKRKPCEHPQQHRPLEERQDNTRKDNAR